MSRDYRFDNLKCLLIFLVVFGHVLEFVTGEASQNLYRVIYSFHMPAFIFVSGYFAKFKPRKIVFRLVWLYVLFQILYIAFNRVVLGGDTAFGFTTPYWLMWYMLAMVFYYCLIPLIKGQSRQKRIVVLVLAVGISLGAGYVDSIGYYLSLSRFCTFLPYFVAGYYMGNRAPGSVPLTERNGKAKPVAVAVLGLLVVACVAEVVIKQNITPQVLYGSLGYQAALYSPLLKAGLIVIASCWIAFLALIMPQQRIPVLSQTGAHSLSVYLLQGFFILLLRRVDLFCFGTLTNLCVAIALSLVLTLALGSKPVAWFLNTCCTGDWLERLLFKKNDA